MNNRTKSRVRKLERYGYRRNGRTFIGPAGRFIHVDTMENMDSKTYADYVYNYHGFVAGS